MNATATNLPEVLGLGRVAAEHGAKAMLVMPPYYFRGASRAGFVDFFRRVLDATPLPVLLYHFPAQSGVDLGLDAVASLAAHRNFVGVKVSESKIEPVLAFIEQARLRILVGNDHLVEEGIARGAAGAVTVCSNIWPGLVRQIAAEAARGGEPDDLQKRLSRARLVIDRFGGIAAAKTILEFRGLSRGFVRPPLVSLGDVEKAALRAAYETLLASMKDGKDRS